MLQKVCKNVFFLVTLLVSHSLVNFIPFVFRLNQPVPGTGNTTLLNAPYALEEDGFTKEFYKTFFDLIRVDFGARLNAAYENGKIFSLEA